MNAYLTGIRSTSQKTTLDGARGWRTATTTNTFDTETGLANPIGRIVRIDDAGDTGRTGDERCTRLTYAIDPAGRIRTAVAQRQVVAATCATVSPDLNSLLISDTRTWFDNATSFNAVVTKGDATRTDQVFEIVGGNPVYRAASIDTFDEYGRSLSSKDVLGHISSTGYTPASGSQATSITYTNKKLWSRTDTVNPAYGNVTSAVDVNGRRYDLGYDALGRITAVWAPGRANDPDTVEEVRVRRWRNHGHHLDRDIGAQPRRRRLHHVLRTVRWAASLPPEAVAGGRGRCRDHRHDL